MKIDIIWMRIKWIWNDDYNELWVNLLCGAHFDCSRRLFADATAATVAVIVDDVDGDVVVDVSKIEPSLSDTCDSTREFDYRIHGVRDGKRNICKFVIQEKWIRKKERK